MIQRNSKIRNALKEANLKQWQLAKLLDIAETTLCVKLRTELPKEEQKRIINIIKANKGE